MNVISQLSARSAQRPAPRNGFDSRQLHQRGPGQVCIFWLGPSLRQRYVNKSGLPCPSWRRCLHAPARTGPSTTPSCTGISASRHRRALRIWNRHVIPKTGRRRRSREGPGVSRRPPSPVDDHGQEVVGALHRALDWSCQVDAGRPPVLREERHQSSARGDAAHRPVE